MSPWELTFAALNASGTRFVVVGGVAVLLHGFARTTVDLDLCLDLTPEPAAKAMAHLVSSGLTPRVPVPAAQFADPLMRASWVRDKAMVVFSMHDPRDPLREVDLFVDSPLPFDELHQRSVSMVVGEQTIRVAAIDDLIAMKRVAGRATDVRDVEALLALKRGRHD